MQLLRSAHCRCLWIPGLRVPPSRILFPNHNLAQYPVQFWTYCNLSVNGAVILDISHDYSKGFSLFNEIFKRERGKYFSKLWEQLSVFHSNILSSASYFIAVVLLSLPVLECRPVVKEEPPRGDFPKCAHSESAWALCNLGEVGCEGRLEYSF